MSGATVLIVPGLRDHVAEHWQTVLATRLTRVRTVPPMAGRTSDRAKRCEARSTKCRPGRVEGLLVVVAQ